MYDHYFSTICQAENFQNTVEGGDGAEEHNMGNLYILSPTPSARKRTQSSLRPQYSLSAHLRERKTFRWGVTRLMFGWSSSVSSPAFWFSFI